MTKPLSDWERCVNATIRAHMRNELPRLAARLRTWRRMSRGPVPDAFLANRRGIIANVIQDYLERRTPMLVHLVIENRPDYPGECIAGFSDRKSATAVANSQPHCAVQTITVDDQKICLAFGLIARVIAQDHS